MIGLAATCTPPARMLGHRPPGSFAAMSFIFASPVDRRGDPDRGDGLGGPRLRLLLIPGLLAAGIGSLVSIGVGSLTGLSTRLRTRSDSAGHAGRLRGSQFGWTIPLAIVVAFVTSIVIRGGMLTHRFVSRTAALVVMLPVIG